MQNCDSIPHSLAYANIRSRSCVFGNIGVFPLYSSAIQPLTATPTYIAWLHTHIITALCACTLCESSHTTIPFSAVTCTIQTALVRPIGLAAVLRNITFTQVYNYVHLFYVFQRISLTLITPKINFVDLLTIWFITLLSYRQATTASLTYRTNFIKILEGNYKYV